MLVQCFTHDGPPGTRLMSQTEELQSSLYSLILQCGQKAKKKKREILVLQYSIFPMEGIWRVSNVLIITQDNYFTEIIIIFRVSRENYFTAFK